MPGRIERWERERDGEPSESILRDRLERRGFTVSLQVYAPGRDFPPHTHDVDKVEAVVSGRFRMTSEGDEFVLEAGDCLSVPRGTEHSAEVLGDEPVVSLDAVRRRE